ncbi:helix-turn-helix transcriptional regulator [Streptomyces sp. NPDC001339]|uniref:helix-turn-helix transcriptional regulator n=1 Tax=Streptomyces sp. NPDC001339 TaxID=3364563 RepID=UPI0036AD327D
MSTDMPARMLRLLSLLQTRREWSGAELAERLGVTGRTVRRDIDRLRELGYAIDGTTGTAGGYRLAPGADLPPLTLDDEEAVAIAVALRTTTGGVSGIEETAVRALAKLERALPTRLRHQVSALQQATVPLPWSGGPQADPAALALLATACRDHEITTFAYTTRHRTPSTRRVEPHALVSSHGRWYLVAYDTERQDWRTFRLDRLTDPTPTGHRVPPRPLPAPDPATFVARTIARAPVRHHARATVPADADTLRQRTGALPDRITPTGNGTCTVDLSADQPLHIAQRLLALGSNATLEADPELAPHLAALGQQLLDAAQNISTTADPNRATP